MKHGSVFLSINSEGGKAPERVQLLPSGGRIIGRDGRWWNNSNPQDVVNRTTARGVDLAIDENHITDQNWSGSPAHAMAWLSDFKVETDGSVWASCAWTDEGRALVEGRAYRYISPVFSYDDATKEIGALIGAGLVNRPNLDLAALNSEQEESMKKIAAAVGLPEDATEDQIVVALNGLKTKAINAQSVDLSQYAPRADVLALEQRAVNAEAKLSELSSSDLKKRAEAAVNTALTARKIAPASKAEYLALCASEEGLTQFEKIMATTGSIIPEGAGPDGLPPVSDEKTSLNTEELSTAKAMGYTPEKYLELKKKGAQ